MRKMFLILVLTSIASATLAHSGKKLSSLFPKDLKYRINTIDSHIGHFYVRKSRVNPRNKNEILRIEQTIHGDQDQVKKMKVKFSEKSEMLSFDVDLEDKTYFFNFYLLEDFPNPNNPGSMTIFDKTTKSFTNFNVTLDPLDDSQLDDDHSHPDS